MPNRDAFFWFKQTFHRDIERAVANTPFSLDMVTGDATTAAVTHALRVGSRLEECLCFAPPSPMPEDIVRRADEEMAHATHRSGRGQPQKRRARRVSTAQ